MTLLPVKLATLCWDCEHTVISEGFPEPFVSSDSFLEGSRSWFPVDLYTEGFALRP